MGTIKIYGREGAQGGEGGRGKWRGGNILAEEQKAGLTITRDLEMGKRRIEASSPFSFNIYSSFDLSFSFIQSRLFSALSLSPSLSLVLSAPYYAKYLLSFMWSSRLEMIRNIKPLKEREGEGGERDRARARDWFLYLEERMLLLLMNIIRGDGHQKLCFSSVSHKCAYILVYTHTARHISKMLHAESLAVKCSVGRALACGV